MQKGYIHSDTNPFLIKPGLTIFLFVIVTCCAFAQSAAYDSALAKELGADEYGMKTYVFVMLLSGENQVKDEAERNKLFAGHQENIRRLAEEGKLIVAGPFYSNEEDYRGLFILDVPTVEEASELMKTDPAIAANVLAVKLYQWYGSAALPVYLETAKRIAKKNP